MLSQNGMPFGGSLVYLGNNTFAAHGMSVEELCYVFESLPNGVTKMRRIVTNSKGKKETTVSVRKK